MADFPNTDFSTGSEFKPDGGLSFDHAEDGTTRGRDEFTATSYTITLKHIHLTSTEATAIISHYDSHKGTKFNLVTHFDTYEVEYTNEPQRIPLSGDKYNMITPLIGKKQ